MTEFHCFAATEEAVYLDLQWVGERNEGLPWAVTLFISWFLCIALSLNAQEERQTTSPYRCG